MRSAKCRAAAAAFSLALVLAGACGTKTQPAIDNSQTKIVNDVRDEDSDNVVEILKIAYDTSQPALEATNRLKPEIEALNKSIDDTVGAFYRTFLANPGEDWVSIIALPFSSGDYLQIVSYWAQYPRYGSDGEIASWNFDRKANKSITLADALEAEQTSQAKIEEAVKSAYAAANEQPGSYISSATAKGFLICGQGAGEYRIFLLDVIISDPETDDQSRFYCYAPSTDKLSSFFQWVYTGECSPDPMEPALTFQK